MELTDEGTAVNRQKRSGVGQQMQMGVMEAGHQGSAAAVNDLDLTGVHAHEVRQPTNTQDATILDRNRFRARTIPVHRQNAGVGQNQVWRAVARHGKDGMRRDGDSTSATVSPSEG